MRITKYMIVLLFICTVTLSSCATPMMPQNQSSFEFGIVGYDDGVELTYDGYHEINVDLYLRNGADSRSAGLMIFIDGVLQECNLYTREETMYISQLKPYEEKMLNLHFRPRDGKSGEVKNIYFLIVINPDFIAVPGEFVAFEEKLYVMQMEPGKVYFASDCYSDIKTTDIGTSYIQDDDMNNSDAFDLRLLPDDSTYITVSSNDKLSLTLQAKSGAEGGRYRVCFFVNGCMQNVFNGCDYLDIVLTPGMTAEYSVTIPGDALCGSDTMFALAFPLGAEERAVRSNPLVVYTESN